MDAPSVVALLKGVIDPSTTLSEGKGINKEDTIASTTTMGEPAIGKLHRMDWQKKSRWPLQADAWNEHCQERGGLPKGDENSPIGIKHK